MPRGAFNFLKLGGVYLVVQHLSKFEKLNDKTILLISSLDYETMKECIPGMGYEST